MPIKSKETNKSKQTKATTKQTTQKQKHKPNHTKTKGKVIYSSGQHS
jgi:hypothetical protein